MEQRDLEPLLKHQIDGLVIVGSGELDRCTEPFRERRIPMVRIGTGPLPAGVAEVGVDEEAGMRMIVQHLVRLGHRRIGFVGGAHHHRQRYLAFQSAVREQGLGREVPGPDTANGHVSEAGYTATRRWLDWDLPLPTALAASSDLIALGVLRALNEAGIRVPADVSVAGFDDLPLAAMVSPPLTTVRQPFDQLAEEAVALLAGWNGREPSLPPASTAGPGVLRPSPCRRGTGSPIPGLSLNRRRSRLGESPAGFVRQPGLKPLLNLHLKTRDCRGVPVHLFPDIFLRTADARYTLGSPARGVLN